MIADINFYASMALNDEKAVKIIQQKLSTIDTSEVKAYEKEKRKLTKRLAELDRLFPALYEDKVMKKITERNYGFMSVKYEKEQLEIDSHLKEIEVELIAKGRNDKGIVDFLALIRNYQGITELPELMNMFREVADIQTADMLNLPVPKANYHNIAVKPSEFQKDLVAELSTRADDVRNKRVDPSIDNMLKITNDGRKLALDQRLINDMLPDDETGKAAI